jgi:hypothetical protein
MTLSQQDPRDIYEMAFTYLGGYLHEDWMYEYASPDAAFEDFLRSVGRDGIARFVEELGRLLALSESDFSEVFRLLSRNLTPRTDYGWDEREWLQGLRDRARAELEQGDAQHGGLPRVV